MTPATTYPPATPEGMALLARLLEDRGVALRVSPGGELQIRDRAKRLSPADRTAVRHYRHDLAEWVSWSASNPNNLDTIKKRGQGTPYSGLPRCGRCGAAEFVEVAIHGGASVRRDCASCGRTWGFPIWRGAAD